MNKKIVVSLLAASLLIGAAGGALGASKLQEIKAYLNSDVSIKVDGTPVKLQDANGNAVIPITYQNTTYLPVRAVSDALGVAVNFDGPSNTVLLGERVEGIAIVGGFNDMYHTKDTKYTTYANKDYKEVFYDNATGNRSSSFMLYPKKQYQTLVLQVAAINKPITEFTVKDSDGNVILKHVDRINPEDGLVDIEVNIGGISTLYVYSSVERDGEVFVPLTTSYYK